MAPRTPAPVDPVLAGTPLSAANGNTPAGLIDAGTSDGQLTEADRYVEFGVSGLKHAAGYVLEEWLPQLQYDKAVKVYREMRDNDAIVGAFIYGIEMLLRGVDWEVEPFDESAEAATKAEFLESCMSDMSHTWEDFIAEVLSMLVFGWSYHNIVYKQRQGDHPEDGTRHSKHTDGLWGWRKLPIRSQETLFRWQFDENGGTQGMWQRDPNNFGLLYIPIEASLLFRTTAHKTNPEGRSILRNAYRPWWYKKRLEEIEAIGVERDLAGIPLIGLPPELFSANATAEQQAAYEQWKRIGQNLRNDDQACVIYPLAYTEGTSGMLPRYKIELMASPGAKQMNTQEIITRYRQDIALTSLADVILLGHDKVGTHALAVTKEDLFIRSLESQLDNIAAVMNNYAIPRLWRLNGWDTTTMPTIVHGELDNVNPLDFSQVLLNLSQAGMPLFPEEGAERFIRTMLELPEPEPAELEALRQMHMPVAPVQPVDPMADPGRPGGQNQPARAKPNPTPASNPRST